MSNRQVTYTLKLNSNISGILNQADRDALHLDSSMWQLQKTLSAFGLGMGADYLINAAKSWTTGAADYEQAMLRIKNASENAIGGIRNGFFINREVDEFKLKLEETVDAYGKFLFKIKNANISSDKKNNLFEEILGVGKVAGLTENQMQPVVNNVGTMLAEGVLEARHLRLLSYSHPQILPYLADLLGLDKIKMNDASKTEDEATSLQKFSRLLSSGKMTKYGVNSNILLDAFDKYWNDVKGKLPETLTTLQSELNDLDNTWERLKNKLVLDNKGELVGFFHELTGGVHWLVEHQDQLLNIASSIIHVVEAYATWRFALIAMQAPFGVVQFFANEQERLAQSIALYSGNAEKQAIVNQTLTTSTLQNTEAIQQQNIATEEEIITLEQKHAAINNLSAALEQESVQMDLFTEAQIQNNAISQESILVYGVKANAIRTLNDLESIQLELFETENVALSQNLVQHSLFTESEIEMSAAMRSTGDALALENEQLAIRNGLLAESAAMSDANAVAAISTLETMKGNKNILNPYSGVLNSGSVSSLVSSVFIVGMAAELINGFLPKGAWSSNKTELSDWGYAISQLVTPYSWFTGMGKDKNIGFGKAMNQGTENSLVEDFKQDFKKAFPTNFDIITGKISMPYVNPKGTQFWELINQIQKLHPEFNFIESLGIKPDNQGNIHTSNAELFSTLDRHGVPLPYLGNEKNWESFFPYISADAKDLAQKKNYGLDASKFGKDSNRLRGNSSNYFTINIHEMNGVKEFKVTTTGGDVSEEKISQIAGDAILKMMIDEINDAQHLRK